MFDTLIDATEDSKESVLMDSGWGTELDELKTELLDREVAIRRLRAKQIALLRRLDQLQVDLADGSKTMAEWVSSHLDVAHHTSARMMRVARGGHADIDARMDFGQHGLDRADLLCRLRSAGGSDELISDADSFSLGHLYGLLDRMRRLDPVDEQSSFEDRYMVIQPSLDSSSYRILGPGARG